jgi:undecaprenyl diphosphate synthase
VAAPGGHGHMATIGADTGTIANLSEEAAHRRSAPEHVAIIMDGNGRWAEARGLPRAEGHRRGVEAVRTVVRAADDLGVRWLTLYSFSSENWSRPPKEVTLLMGLLRHFLRRDLAELHAENVCIRIIGARSGVDADLLAMLADAEVLTARNTGLRLQIAFNYGSRDELARAAQRLAVDVAEGRLTAEEITPERLTGALDTAGCPDPDLLIRTGGEVRLSNFLLWQAAYAELVFTPTYWPEFGRSHLEEAIRVYHSRDRRFGGLKAHNGVVARP